MIDLTKCSRRPWSVNMRKRLVSAGMVIADLRYAVNRDDRNIQLIVASVNSFERSRELAREIVLSQKRILEVEGGRWLTEKAREVLRLMGEEL